ncbi:MAG: hypothetical protein A2X64_10940 [Ignavibacteria bacterium GWF2_33_9]|nr:MAG: hypothetical protein A2X64_10940 [Ignavibacteria bacterium GWF2_33_9]
MGRPGWVSGLPRTGLHHFNGAGHGHAAAAAEGGKAQGLFPFFHGIHEGDHDSGAGGAHGMAEADAGTVDVGDFPVQTQFFFAAQVLSCKGLVDFDEFKIRQSNTGRF